MTLLLYDNYVQNIAKSFDNALSEIETVHNFEYGAEFEVIICKVLRSILPHKFGICRGYAVNQHGDVAGDDIIIYDRFSFPTMRRFGDDYTLKEKVPIEAVFAYIEAKHTISLDQNEGSSFDKAIDQIANVKKLCDQRTSTMRSKEKIGWPDKLNPIYSSIFACQASKKKNSKNTIIESSEEIYKYLENCTCDFADFVVVGKSNIIFPTLNETLEEEIQDVKAIVGSPFFVPDVCKYSHKIIKNLAFGIAIIHLLWALENIELDPMPWSIILSDSINTPQSK